MVDLSSSLCNKLPEAKYDQVDIGDDPLVCFMAGKSIYGAFPASHGGDDRMVNSIINWLVVYSTYPSEKYEFVSWDDYSQYMEKRKMFQTTNQLIFYKYPHYSNSSPIFSPYKPYKTIIKSRLSHHHPGQKAAPRSYSSSHIRISAQCGS